MRTIVLWVACLLLALPAATSPARAAGSFDRCEGFIEDLPVSLSAGKYYCLAHDVVHAPPSLGDKQFISVHLRAGSTLDCQGHSLTTEYVYAIYATADDVTVRDCVLRADNLGRTGVLLIGERTVFVDNVVEGYGNAPVYVSGDGSLVKGNVVRNVHKPSGGLTAMVVRGAVDVVDNTVRDIEVQTEVVAINIGNHTGGQVRGNRIRDVTAAAGPVIGIYSVSPVRTLVRDNRFIGVGAAGSTAVVCASAQARLRDNIVSGFATAFAGCGDAGGNDIDP